MIRRWITILLAALIILFLFLFRNITYAFICNSERIDRNTLNVMVQGAISPTREFTLERDGNEVTIILPVGAAELEENVYLVPTSRFMRYFEFLEEEKGYTIERFGSFASVQSGGKSIFNISVMSYTGAYMRLEYSLPR